MNFNLFYTFASGDTVSVEFRCESELAAKHKVFNFLIRDLSHGIIYFALYEGVFIENELVENGSLLFEFHGNLTEELLRGILFERHE